ncbi:hypothetical protein GCM10025880_32660 [Methylorubrum aminovorans]|nr:hypothetical protein GCM10025880_32660 [Methylorubrum aminovorans]
MPVGLVSPLSLRERFLKAPFDSLEPAEVLALLSRAPAGLDPAPFRYVVTPNVDHVVRLSADPSLAPLYEGAWLSLCDSKPIAALSRLLIPGGLPHLPGSTLTEILFRTVIAPSDRIALVVAHPSLAAQMRAAFPEVAFDILAAPPDIDGDPAAFAACAAFVAGSTARFTFIAVGAPRSERIAFQASSIRRRGAPPSAWGPPSNSSSAASAAPRSGCSGRGSNGCTASRASRGGSGAATCSGSPRSPASPSRRPPPASRRGVPCRGRRSTEPCRSRPPPRPDHRSKGARP